MNLDLKLKASIHNKFDVEVIDSKTKKIKQKAVGYNVITNNLWNAIGSTDSWTYGNGYFLSIQYGSGDGTPSVNDTSLFTFSGEKRVNFSHSYNTDIEKSYVYATRQIQLQPSEAVGVNITEVGISTSKTLLMTHAMLQDMNGNKISITKTDTDIINIYATIYCSWPKEYSDINNDVMMIFGQGREYDIAAHLLGVSGFNSSWPFLTGWYTCQQGMKNYRYQHSENIPIYKNISAKFNSKTKTLVFNKSRLEAGDYNIKGGLHKIVIYNDMDGRDYFLHSPWLCLGCKKLLPKGSTITKESVGTGDGVTSDFSTKFDLPTNAKVYVDGVLDPSATVSKNIVNVKNMFSYFEEIRVTNGKIYPWIGVPDQAWTQGTIEDRHTYYNRYYNLGLYSCKGSAHNLRCSDDGIKWDACKTTWDSSSGRYIIDESQRYKKYWSINRSGRNAETCSSGVSVYNGKNIHFTNPPAEGSVITIDYDTEVIAKDDMHIFDFQISVKFN